jgi:hypothetical protein
MKNTHFFFALMIQVQAVLQSLDFFKCLFHGFQDCEEENFNENMISTKTMAHQ